MDSNRTKTEWVGHWRRLLFTATIVGYALLGNPGALFGQNIESGSKTADINGPDKTTESATELFALAASHYTDSQWQLAIDEFTRLNEAWPDDENAVTGLFYLGESFVQLGQYDQARQAFSRFLNSTGDSSLSVRARFRRAECLYLDGKTADAVVELSQFLKEHDSDPLVEYALPYYAELQFESGDVEAARRSFETALSRFPDSGLSDKCRLGLAHALRELGEYEEAERFFDFVTRQTQSELADDALIGSARMWASLGNWSRCGKRAAQLTNEYPHSKLRQQGQYLLARVAMADDDWLASWKILEPMMSEPWDEGQFARVGLDAALVALRLDELSSAGELIRRVQDSTGDAVLLEFAAALEIDMAGRGSDFRQLEILVNRFQADWPESTWLPRSIEMLARQLYSAGEYQNAADRYARLIELAIDREQLASSCQGWRYLQGLALIGCAKFSEAVALLRQIEQFDNDREFEGATALALATALAGAGNHAEATTWYEKYLELVPAGADIVRARADWAVALARTGHLDNAISALQPLIPDHQHEPPVLAACESIAELALTQQQTETARRWFRILADSEHPVFGSRGTTGLIWTGDQQALQRDLVAELKLQDDPSMTLEALLAQAQRLQADGDHRQAIQILERIIEVQPESRWATDARVRLAVSLVKTGDEAGQLRARELLEAFVQNQSEHPLRELAMYELAWLRSEQQQPDGARKLFLRITEEYPDSQFFPDSLYRAATLSRQLGERQTAIDYFEQLIDKRPGDALAHYAHYALGEMAIEDGKLAEAIRYFEQVQQADAAPELMTPAMYWMAECYYRNGQTAIAERHFQSLRNQKMENPETGSAVILRLAQCGARRDDWNQVRSLLAEVEEQTPELVDGYQFDYLRARVLMSQAKFDEARDLLNRVLNDADARYTQTAAMSQWLIGESWFHQQEFASALRAYLLVDSLYDYPEWQALALLQAAKCHEQLDNDEYAETTIERLITTFPDSGIIADARQLRSRIRQKTSRPVTVPANYSKPGK